MKIDKIKSFLGLFEWDSFVHIRDLNYYLEHLLWIKSIYCARCGETFYYEDRRKKNEVICFWCWTIFPIIHFFEDEKEFDELFEKIEYLDFLKKETIRTTKELKKIRNKNLKEIKTLKIRI